MKTIIVMAFWPLNLEWHKLSYTNLRGKVGGGAKILAMVHKLFQNEKNTRKGEIHSNDSDQWHKNNFGGAMTKWVGGFPFSSSERGYFGQYNGNPVPIMGFKISTTQKVYVKNPEFLIPFLIIKAP